MVEQPLPARQDDGVLGEIERVLPVCLDESCQPTLSGEPWRAVRQVRHGQSSSTRPAVFTEALALLPEARTLGFAIMVGTMMTSSLGRPRLFCSRKAPRLPISTHRCCSPATVIPSLTVEGACTSARPEALGLTEAEKAVAPPGPGAVPCRSGNATREKKLVTTEVPCSARVSDMARTVYVNGAWPPESEARISVFDRGFLFADGVYEVTSVLDGKLVDFDGHMARLRRSLGDLDIPAPAGDLELEELHHEIVARNDLGEGMVYLQVTRGAADRDFAWAPGLTPSLILFTQASAIIDIPTAGSGIKVITIPDIVGRAAISRRCSCWRPRSAR